MLENKSISQNRLRQFVFAYIKTMRLYYSFVTGTAGWIGVSFYFWIKTERLHETLVVKDYLYGSIALIILFASWGINQVFNDWLGLPEDRVNAPHRPMVSGELNIKWALSLSSSLMFGASIVAYFINPISLIPLFGGFVLNFIYNYSKAWGIWANVIFGIMIASCTAFGFLASGPMPDKSLFMPDAVSFLFLTALVNGLMTYYTYFKDYEGDKEAGKNTFIVRHGLNTARWVGLVAAFLPLTAFVILKSQGYLTFPLTHHFLYCGIMTVFIQIWTGVRFFKHPVGPKTYFSNATNFRACACAQVSLIAMYDGVLAIYLFSLTYVLLGFLFGLYDDVKG